MNNLQPMVLQEFAKLDPNSMDDLDRILWHSKLHPKDHLGYYKKPDHSQDIPTLMPQNPGVYCRDYWAEPLNSSNANLRNHGFETQCRTQLEKYITKTYSWLRYEAEHEEGNELVYSIPNQYVRILQWLDLNGDDLMDSPNPPYRILEEQSKHAYAYEEDQRLKQEYLDRYQRENQTRVDPEWLGILRAAGMNSSSSSDLRMCHRYYPQVFYGYWIPMDPKENPSSDQKQEASPASGERLGVAEPPGAGSDAHVSPLQRDHGDPRVAFTPRSLAGKPLAGFRATPDRRIIVLCGMIVSVIRFKNPLLHRQSSLRKRRLGENRGFRPSF